MISTNKTFGFSFARRSTRRWIVIAYWCLMVAACIAFERYQLRHGFDFISVGLVFNCIVCTGLLGGVRGGGPVRAFRGVRWIPWQNYQFPSGLLPQSQSRTASPEPSDVYAPLDERETGLRDRMHFLAYTLARWFALLLFGLYSLIAVVHPAWLAQAGPFFLFLLTVTLWSLPQSLILWTEPDMELEA